MEGSLECSCFRCENLKVDQAAQNLTSSAKAGEVLAFLHNLFQCLAVENISIYQSGTPLGLVCVLLSSSTVQILASSPCWSVPLKPTLLQVGQAQVLQPLLTTQLLQPTHHGQPVLKSLHCISNIVVQKASNWMQGSRRSLASAR